MAEYSKDKLKICGQTLVNKLEALDCPYTEDVDESWIKEFLFKPGEHRIRLLQWLFTKFDSSLDAILDPQFVVLDSRMDSRIQRLLYVASSLGLCDKDDVDLIRGCTSVSKQLSFMEQLLDLVYIKDRSEDPQLRCMNSPGMISEGTSLKEQFYTDCWFIDTLAEQEKLDSVLSSDAKLLPPDITKQLDIEERARKQKGESPRLELPEISKLREAVTESEKNLQNHEEKLAYLKENFNEPVDDQKSTENIQCTLRLVLSELSQILTGFSYCFENEFRQWCNKTSPQLNEIGPTFKRIHGTLGNFAKMLSDVGKVRSSHTMLNLHLSEKTKSLANKIEQCSDGSSLLSDIEDYLAILEKALARGQTASSRSEQNTLVISDIVLLS